MAKKAEEAELEREEEFEEEEETPTPKRKRRKRKTVILSDEDLDAVDSMIDRYGTAEEAIHALRRDNYRYRERIRRLRDGQEDVDPVPEGGLVLNGEEAKRWKSYLELGDDPGEIKTALRKKEEYEKEQEKRDKQTKFAKAAKAVGYREDVLIDLAESKGLPIEMREVEVDGEKQEIPFVVREGEEAKRLTEYAESDLSAYLAALKATDDEESKEEEGKPGTRFPRTPAKGQGSKKLDVGKLVGARDVRPSALRKSQE